MNKDSYHEIKKLLASKNLKDLRRGLNLVREEVIRIGSSEARPLFEIVTTIFYIDPLDRPDLAPILDEATSLIIGFGEWVIPVLVENLDAGDIKAQFAIAHTLGRIGSDAIAPLMQEYEMSSDPTYHSFILYALGKIKSPQVVQAAHIVIEAAQTDDPELCDTAVRVIGKFAEAIDPRDLPAEYRLEFLEQLRQNLAATNPGIRAKAMRSLGKMVKHGHIRKNEHAELKELCNLILGTDDNFNWDHAYIVRKEAKETLKYF